MLDFYKKLQRIGIRPGLSPAEEQKVVLLNRLVIFVYPFIFAILIEDLYAIDFQGIGISIFATFLFTLTLFLQYRHLHFLAQVYQTVMVTALIGVLNGLFGVGMGAEFCYFSFVVLSVLFFDRTRDLILILIYIFLVFLATRFYLFSIEEPILIDSLNPSTYYVFMFTNIFTVTMIVSSFIKNRVQMDSERGELLESLSRKNVELERFAYITSHDLKTPLRNINSFLYLIKRKLGDDIDPEVTKYLKKVFSNTDQMFNLVEDVLEFSRLGSEDVAMEKIELNEALSQVLGLLKDDILAKNVQVEVANLPRVKSNFSMNIVLFQNLLENAIKYNTNENPMIKVSSVQKENGVLISVADNGIGISKEYHDRIFNMFVRLHTQDRFQGTGIGLASVRKIMNEYGGSVTLESKQGEGATFHLFFPN